MSSEVTTIADQAAKTLGLSQLVPLIYEDVLQPAARESGQRLVVVAKAVSIALAPLEIAVWGYQHLKDYLSATVAAKLAAKGATDIRKPDLVIAGPVIMGMLFAADAPHLRQLYANLIASAMDAQSVNRVHPSFVQLIQQLSPAEAKILRELSSKYHGGDVILENSDVSPIYPGRPIPLQWRDLCQQFGVTETALADSFYYNLARLGIIVQRNETSPKYIPEGFNKAGYREPTIESETSAYVHLTDYGNLFFDVCVR